MELKADYKSILKIAFPLILANLVSGIGQIIDTAFVNRIGEKELNGTVIGGMIWMFFSFTVLGFSSYFQRLIAKNNGERKNEEVEKIVDNTIIIGAILVIFITVIYALLKLKGLSLMIKDQEIVTCTFIYLDVLIFCLPVSVCISFLSAFFSALGKTKVITFSVVVYIAVNLILDYLLIFGNNGFPKLGVFGSALATVIALICSLLTYVFFVVKYKILAEYKLFSFTKLSKDVIQHISKKSTPLALQNIFHILAYWIFFMMIEKMGSGELRISLIIRSLYLFLCLPVFGLGRAVNTVISTIIGRGDYENINTGLIKSHQVSFIVSLLLCTLIFLFPETLLRVYTNDTDLINQAIPILKVLLISIILFSIGTINTNIIIATGETKYVFIIGAISIAGYLLFAYASIFVWKTTLTAVWLSDWINWGVFTLLSTLYLLFWKAKQKRLFNLV